MCGWEIVVCCVFQVESFSLVGDECGLVAIARETSRNLPHKLQHHQLDDIGDLSGHGK